MANYIKDSGNNYTLYVDKNTDFQVEIDVSTFSLLNTTDVDFLSYIRVSPESKTFQEFTVEKTLNTIRLILSADDTSFLKHPRYSFDVLYRKDGKVTKAFGGIIVVDNSTTSF